MNNIELSQLSNLSSFDIAVFAKDIDGRFIYCNEHFAKLADTSSPNDVVGKKDDEMIWYKQAKIYRHSDDMVLRGQPYRKVIEPQSRGHEITYNIVSKSILHDSDGKVRGIYSVFYEADGLTHIKRNGAYDFKSSQYYFYLNNQVEFFNNKELAIFKLLLKGLSAHLIAERVYLSKRTVEKHIHAIKQKLQCDSKYSIIERAISLNLYYLVLPFDDT